MIEFVKIPRGGAGSQFVMAAAQARAVADAGDVAMVHETSDPRRTAAAYVWRDPTGSYVVDAATFLPADWHDRLRRVLHAANRENEGTEHE